MCAADREAGEPHEDDVPFFREVIGGAAIDLGAFTFATHEDQRIVAGPCPRCGGPPLRNSRPAYDVVELEDLAVGGDVVDLTVPGWDRLFGRPARTVPVKLEVDPDVPFECRCGRSHGGSDTTGCGASWVIRWRRP